MLTYEQLRESLEKHKTKIIVGALFVLVFLSGFGAGRFDSQAQIARLKSQVNYSKTTTTTQKTAAPAAGGQEVKGEAVLAPAAAVLPTPEADCKIKGNISSSGRKIYHVPGGAFYKTVKPEMCFNTEAEALAAGFVKSGR